MKKNLYQQMYLQEEYYWWHIAKRKLVVNFIPKTNCKILDVGCGTGKLMEELLQNGHLVYGIENEPTAIEFCKKRGIEKIQIFNLEENLNIDNDSFDVITCLDVLEHIEKDENLIKEFKRIVKPSGILILTVPSYMWLWSYWDEILGHKRRYNKKILFEKMQKVGFQIVKISHFYSFLLPIAIVFRVIKSIAKKRTSDFIDIPNFINKILLFLSALEREIIKRNILPFGLSIFVVAKKI
ncbi:MAG: class I SAM-dependent methyltransferase [Endomicrobiia bacterium]